MLNIGNVITDFPILSINLIIISYNWLTIWRAQSYILSIPNTKLIPDALKHKNKVYVNIYTYL